MNNYPSFQGKKFRATGDLVDCGLDKYTNERVYKDEFEMTSSYKLYLLKKQVAEAEAECKVLKHKLEFELQKYGEVDPIDLNEYKYKLAEAYRLIARLTK